MSTRRCIAVLILVLVLVFSGCSGGKADEMYETAQFEELQKNFPHAKKLYQEILEKYPQSEAAQKASKRLKELGIR